MQNLFKQHQRLWICLLLALLTGLIYWQVQNHAFLDYDDGTYVTENPYIQTGFTMKSLAWALSATYASNWHPLTWISHLLDVQLFGLKPAGHHLVNLLFHIANTLLLFLVLSRMTRALWQSAFVAALFALHPLHVESVAWVAERKDVLSAFFWMLTLGAYAFYTERPGLRRYGAVLLFFVLGLMAKPMLVTLPFVFLLLDYWPLGRFPQLHSQEKKKVSGSLKSLRPLLLEKIPFFLLSAASSVITYVAQQRGGAVESFQSLPLSERLGNALVSYILYIGKMLWPQNLAVMYPHYGMPSLWQAGGAFLLLLGITGLVIGRARLRPYLMVGWLWYLGTLVPVIGIVQVGAQAMADRYTYLPLIGLFIMAAWGVSDLTVSWKYRKESLILLAGTVLSILMISTWFQLQHWKNSSALFENALQKTKNNAVAHSVLGIVLYKQGKVPEAVGHFQEAIRIDPAHSSSYNNLGLVLRNQGKIEEAIVYYQEAIRNNPRNTEALNNMGSALYALGRKQEAADYYIRVIHINPDHATAHYNLGNVFGSQGKITEAIAQFREAVRVKPDDAEAQNNLGYGLLLSGKPDEAIEPLRKALEIQPDSVLARRNLNEALARQKELR